MFEFTLSHSGFLFSCQEMFTRPNEEFERIVSSMPDPDEVLYLYFFATEDEIKTMISKEEKDLNETQIAADEKCHKCSYCFKISN